MAKYVPDIVSKRWVVISSQRWGRPGEGGKKHGCPFCPGHEKETPPEIVRYGEGEPNQPGWKIRIIPNKFTITDIHEVIIHSPDHNKDIEDFLASQVELLLKAYRDRYNFYKKRGQVLIFCNHGEHSGASLGHPHSQLVVIPSQINLDTLSREPLNNIVDENKFFNVYCPDFSQWPYEVWIAPKKEGGIFGDSNDEELIDLSGIIKKIFIKLKKIHAEKKISMGFGYNYYIYPKENWYLRIIPRFVNRAGFELGTGLSVNVVDPYEASLEFKGIEEKMVNVMKKLKKF